MNKRVTHSETWQSALTNVVTDPLELFKLLEINHHEHDFKQPGLLSFPLRVPKSFIAKMKKGDINDALLRQILPIREELNQHPEFSFDPLGEYLSNMVSGLIHKYKNRVLLTVTGSCAINCRYCFRRHFPYSDNNPGTKGWQKAIEYIKQNPDIQEVIYSGGDPLVANDKLLSQLTFQISEIPHVTTLRIHSRLPIVIPQRINHDFVQWFCQTRLKPVLVLHCNHPQELDEIIHEKMLFLREHQVTLLNQAVLLKDINDNADILTNLSNKLFSMGILPYYLHLLDKVHGATHFDIPILQAKNLHKALMERLPGYLVPKLVKEECGKPYKSPIF